MNFKFIVIFILVIMFVVFVSFNMHVTNIYFPLIKPMQINVISLLLIGFILGSSIWFIIILREKYNNKKKNTKNK